MDEEQQKELAEDIRKHGLREPCGLWKDGDGKEWLLDGRNRLDAMALAKDADHESHFVTLRADTDPWTYVLSANVHRRHLTRAQKRALITKVLEAKPEQSNRQIAKQTGVDHKTVAKERAAAEGRGEIPHVDKATDTKGRRQPVKRSKPKHRRPRRRRRQPSPTRRSCKRWCRTCSATPRRS